MSFLLLLLASLTAPLQPMTTADAELWTAAVAQLRGSEFGQDKRELIICDRTLHTLAFRTLQDSTRETGLLTLLRRRNSTSVSITGVRLSPNTRLLSSDFCDLTRQQFSQKPPPGRLLTLTLPAFSDDGMRAIIVYSAFGGFDDSQGAFMIFEKKNGKWIVTDYLEMWIT